ncbi:MAG: transglutaminase domain-containing protein [Porcipelethomonas sp.]
MKIYKYLSVIAGISALSAAAAMGVSADDSTYTPAQTEIVTTALAAEITSETTFTTIVSDIQTAQSTGISAVTEITDVSAAEEPDEVNGWTEDENGKKYYLSDGQPLKGYQVIDGEEYYFAANGAMKNGWYTIGGVRMYFSPETGQRQLGWVEYKGNTFYVDENGKYVGIRSVDGKEYIFDSCGILQTGWTEYDGYKYYCGEDGIYKNECEIDGVAYIFSSKGKFRSGWQNADGLRVFYDYETAQPLYGWIRYNGNIYYSSEENGKYTGEKTVDGVKYRFDENGCLETGFQKFSDGTRYYDESGNIALGIQTIDNNKYYFSSSGIMQTGLQTISGKTYYFGSDGAMQTGWQTISGKTYYFGSDGAMQTGWQTISGKKYYFGSDGAMQTGWQTISGKKYYFSSDGAMQTGWQTIDGKKYYFGNDGVMRTNVSVDGYDIGADGVAVKLSAVQKRADAIIASVGKSANAIYSYVRSNNVYKFMESTKSLATINSMGWGYFADYAMDNRFVVCYYFAALQDLLFRQAGYETRIIYGTQGFGDHYWNQVKINGTWMNFDACMGHYNVTDSYLANKGFVWYQYVYPEYN